MSYSANRFTSMHTVKLGALAPMHIMEAVLLERSIARAAATAHTNLIAEVDQMIFQAFYANRFASIPMSTRSLARTDCLDVSTVTIYRSPRAARRSALMQARAQGGQLST